MRQTKEDQRRTRKSAPPTDPVARAKSESQKKGARLFFVIGHIVTFLYLL